MVHFSMAAANNSVLGAVLHCVVAVNNLAFHDALVRCVEVVLGFDLDGHNWAVRCVADGRKCVVEAALCAAVRLSVVGGRKSRTTSTQRTNAS